MPPSRSSSSRSKPKPKPRSRWPLAEPPPGLFPTGHDLLRLLAVLSIAAAAAAACSLLLNRRPKPFCDLDSDSDAYAYAYASDLCEPCPQNGRCVDGKLECVQGFKKYGKICIEDGLVTQTATKISELLQLRICHEHARALCGQASKLLFQERDISNIADELLFKDPVRLSEDGIKFAKTRVLESARGFFEITLTYDKIKAFECPELIADLHRPLTCQVRQWIFRNIIFMMTFCILQCSGFYGAFTTDEHFQKGQNKYMSSAINTSATFFSTSCKREKWRKWRKVCEILEDNAINAKIGNCQCEPWVVTCWLRDHLLVPRERRNALLWKKVEELILEDSRIDQYPKVIKGESKVVFEWQASGSLSAEMKKMQGKSRTGVGARKLAEELGGCVGEVSYCPTRKQASNHVI